MDQDQTPHNLQSDIQALVDPNTDPSHFSIEAAAVKKSPGIAEVLGSQATTASVELAAVRSQEPLTDAEVATLESHRGQPVTADQRAGMNAARAAGIHHSIV